MHVPHSPAMTWHSALNTTRVEYSAEQARHLVLITCTAGCLYYAWDWGPGRAHPSSVYQCSSVNGDRPGMSAACNGTSLWQDSGTVLHHNCDLDLSFCECVQWKEETIRCSRGGGLASETVPKLTICIFIYLCIYVFLIVYFYSFISINLHILSCLCQIQDQWLAQTCSHSEVPHRLQCIHRYKHHSVLYQLRTVTFRMWCRWLRGPFCCLFFYLCTINTWILVLACPTIQALLTVFGTALWRHAAVSSK